MIWVRAQNMSSKTLSHRGLKYTILKSKIPTLISERSPAGWEILLLKSRQTTGKKQGTAMINGNNLDIKVSGSERIR
jgi:hypothetical protein